MADDDKQQEPSEQPARKLRPGDTATMRVTGQELRRWQILRDELPEPELSEDDDDRPPPPPPPPVRRFIR